MSGAKGCLALLGAILAAGPSAAQSVVELRASTTKYRYVEFVHTFASGAVVDLLYIGAPGADELYVGAGYQWKAAKALTVTPTLYAVGGKQGGERGVVPGALISFDDAGWKAVAFVGHFIPIDGDVPRYTFLDTLDVTRTLGRWEAGVSSGFFRQAGEWNPLVGPVVKRNGAHGSWAASVRWGYRTDARLVRIITF